MTFSHYGAACQGASLALPGIEGGFDGSSGCTVTVELFAPPTCCNTYLVAQFLVVGLSPASHVFPSGCTLLAFPDWVIALSPTPGFTLLHGQLPADPSLVGMSVYLQGVVDDFTTIGMDHDLGFSDGLRLKLG